jgi:hypothetical protein
MLSTNFNKPTYIYKRFRVKRADGKSTTVSVDPALVVRACQTMGSLSSVGRLVRDAALSYDATATGKNRSAHVSEILKGIVSKGRQAPVTAIVATATAA